MKIHRAIRTNDDPKVPADSFLYHIEYSGEGFNTLVENAFIYLVLDGVVGPDILPENMKKEQATLLSMSTILLVDGVLDL
jgi:hypothetical protein